jgi:hypothetical protein
MGRRDRIIHKYNGSRSGHNGEYGRLWWGQGVWEWSWNSKGMGEQYLVRDG